MSVRVQSEAPDFVAQAVVGEEFQPVRLSGYRGQYVLLFFYPLDFTFVCPTEIIAFSDRAKDFQDRKCQILGVSIDSHFTHLAWIKTPRNQGGLGKLNYPLVSDLNKDISRNYDVLLSDNTVALRGLFLIDKSGVLRHMLVNDLPLGRSVDEALRVLDALQHFEQHGEVCPADWHKGGATIKADVKGSKEYFSKAYSS